MRKTIFVLFLAVNPKIIYFWGFREQSQALDYTFDYDQFEFVAHIKFLRNTSLQIGSFIGSNLTIPMTIGAEKLCF